MKEQKQMGPSDRPSLPERVAILETMVPAIQISMKEFAATLHDQGALLNTIHLQTTRLSQCVETVNTERSRWKDPMLYVSAISVCVAIFAVFHK